MAADWYLRAEEGEHRGPFTTDELLDAIGEDYETAEVVAEQWFESPGTFGWQRVLDIPELAVRLHATRASGAGLDVTPGGFSQRYGGGPNFGRAVLMIPSAPPKKPE